MREKKWCWTNKPVRLRELEWLMLKYCQEITPHKNSMSKRKGSSKPSLVY